MADKSFGEARRKRCFVTIGATAPFNSLVKAVLEPRFLEALHNAKYTELRIQYGDEGEAIFNSKTQNRLESLKGLYGIEITGFGFNKSGLHEEMALVKGRNLHGISTADEGIVVSHAGSGSVLDAMRIGVPLIVVPNTDLLHNHQVELAEALAEQDYVIHGQLDNLAASIPAAEEMRKRMRQWPPPHAGTEKYPDGLASVIAEEMGWLD